MFLCSYSQLDELRRREAADERVMYSIAQENKTMSDPLRQVLSEIQRLSGIREEYRSDLNALGEAKKATTALQAQHEELKWEHEVLTQRYHRAASERSALESRFSDAIHEVHKRTTLRTLTLKADMLGMTLGRGNASVTSGSSTEAGLGADPGND